MNELIDKANKWMAADDARYGHAKAHGNVRAIVSGFLAENERLAALLRWETAGRIHDCARAAAAERQLKELRESESAERLRAVTVWLFMADTATRTAMPSDASIMLALGYQTPDGNGRIQGRWDGSTFAEDLRDLLALIPRPSMEGGK